MPFVAALGPVAVASTPAIGVLVTSGLAATGAVIKCKTGPDRSCGNKNQARADVPSVKSSRHLLRMARRQAGACGVPQFNFDMCQNDLTAVVVQTSIPEPGTARFDNVPASCLNLATALTGGCGVGPPYPLICGSACMQYTSLSEEQLDQLSDFLAPAAVEV